ncbi:hypothetical protein F3Y22_tig00111584pilonHSYRG00076 [Hibiscus syriacus]|uniref:RNase H type-1 domain-containing protein n=1 Tax=Hibiscus syriacus TaxID=106335 RepID=A0A6A2YIP2_HIBSY|nr:hypothetical protein F3Y22_tig00111584pilonHSYRG00076 [Hibiscus syriacus]
MFDILLWRIWKQRCNFIFNGESWSLEAIIRNACACPFYLDQIEGKPPVVASCEITREDGSLVKVVMLLTALCSTPSFGGLLDGLYVAWNNGARRLMVEMDNAEAVSLITTPSHDHKPTLVRRIREMLQKRWTVVVDFIPQEANRVADALARYGFSGHIGLTLTEW